jgi:hypothetical protein
MNKRILTPVITALLLLSCGSEPHRNATSDSTAMDSVADDTTLRQPATAPELSDSAFVPAHYRVADVAFGNLDLDAFTDAVVMLRHDADDVGMFSEMPRWIYILTGTPDGNFEVKSKNLHVTFPQSDGGMFGDPYDGIGTEAGAFTVNHYGGSRYRWTSSYVFEYDTAKTEWYYARHYSSWMDMLMEDTTVYRDSLIVKDKITFSQFNHQTAPYSSAGE